VSIDVLKKLINQQTPSPRMGWKVGAGL